MANFKIPNLCGASPDLNGALDEINKLKDKLTANIDVDASALKADLETGLGDLQSAFNKLEIKLPEVPNVNFQAEITSLINDIDRTSIQGLAAFNTKLAQLELDFGNTLKEKGLSLNSLVTDATTKLSAGGNVCDLAPNIEIPAANSGSGVTTEEKEERGSGTSITISETPKEVVSVQGKKTGSTFFGNVTYKQSGRTFTTTQRDADNNLISYAELKVTYIISLVKEKPIATKQASKDGEKEEPSIVTTNSVAVEKNVQGKIQSLLKKIDMKGISGLATEKENAGIQEALGKLKDGSFKAAMEADIAKAKEEQKKIWQDPLNYKRVVPPQKIVSSTTAKTTTAAINEVKKTREIKVTTTENRNTVTTTTTRIETKGGGSTTISVPKTEKSTISINGFAMRKVKIKEYFRTIDAPDRYDKPRWKLVDNIGKDGVDLKQVPFSIERVRLRFNKEGGRDVRFAYDIGEEDGSIDVAINDKTVFFTPKGNADVGALAMVDTGIVLYTVLEKVDPNFKG